MRITIFALAFVILTLVAPVLCDYQVLPIGGYNISLDFGGQNIAIMPIASAYEDCLGVNTDYAKMIDTKTGSSSFVYLFSYSNPRTIRDLKKELYGNMDALCDKMSMQSYEQGYISAGSDRNSGQMFWGMIEPLNLKGDCLNTSIEIIATFENESLNEHLVKTAKCQVASGRHHALIAPACSCSCNGPQIHEN